MIAALHCISTASLGSIARRWLRTAGAAALMVAMSVAHAAQENWPQFWRERATAETRAILDEAFAEFSNRSSDRDLTRYTRAIPVLAQLLLDAGSPDTMETESRLSTGRAWLFLGRLYLGLSKYEDCLVAEQKGLLLIESASEPDSLELAQALSGHSNTYALRKRYAEAAPLLQRSVAILEKVRNPDHLEVATRLNDLAGLYQSMGQYAQALPLYLRSLAIREKVLGAEHHVAASLNNLGGLYLAMGQYEQALPLYQRGLVIGEKVLGAEHPDVAIVLNNLAELYRLTGRYTQSLPLYQRSLAMGESALGADHPDIATRLNNLAVLYKSMGQYAQALPLSRRSLLIREKALGAEHPDVAASLNNLAELYSSMGQYAQALPLYRRSLVIGEKVLGAEHPDVATLLNNLAGLYRAMGQYAQALPLYQRSLAMGEKALGAEHPDVATRLNNLAALYKSMGRFAQALPLYRRSLVVREKALGAEHPDVAASLTNLAALYQAMGQYAQALRPLYRAEQIAVLSGAPQIAWLTQSNLSSAHAAQRQPTLAVFWGKQAINTIQSLRVGISSLDRDLQQSFLQDKRSTYTALADLLIREGRIPEAQRVMAMLKEEEHFDFVRRDAASDPRSTEVSLTGAERVMHERYYAIRQDLARFASEYDSLQRKRKLGEITAQEEARSKVLAADLSKARAAFDGFVGGLSKLLASDPEQAQSVRALQQQIQTHRTLLGTLGEAKQGVATLQYIASEQRLHIILTTASVQLAREVVIERTALNSKIAAFRLSVQNPRIDPRAPGRELYELLIAPVRAALEAQGVHTLILFLDGSLRYLPFAALVQDDNHYLIERYRLAIHTEASRSAFAQRPQAHWQVAALGVTRGFPEQNFSALHAVKAELDGIVRPDVLPGRIYLDERFNLKSFESSLDSPVLHVASHFRFLPGSDSSFLLLGDGSSLTLHDISTRDLRFDAVDLLTLSACETAVGGGYNENGLEVEGLGVLAQIQGAKAVLATLWSVADSSTGELMQHFYRLRQGQQLTKAEALRQAQLTLLRGDRENAASATATTLDMNRGAPLPQARDTQPDFEPTSTAPFSHPFYWAPFILMGNWL